MYLNVHNDVGLAVNTGKSKYMEVGRHRGRMANEHITTGSNSYEKLKTFKMSILFIDKSKLNSRMSWTISLDIYLPKCKN